MRPLSILLATLAATMALPVQTASAAPPNAPSELLDLSNWSLTLPTGATENPDEIYQPQLHMFRSEWFDLTPARDAVAFRAPVGGMTTEGSDYPRSELREMAGPELAHWSNAAGTHTLETRQAISRLPVVKPQVVVAQIHDSEDDVVLVRLESEKLIAEWDDGAGEAVLNPAYALGTPFDLRITATPGHIQIFHNGALAADIPKTGTDWYFKVGDYVQSNPLEGDDPATVAEVLLYALRIEHLP